MFFSEKIIDFVCSTSLPPEEIKTYREYLALAVLKYSFPEKFSRLHKAEAPDLQDIDGGIGIEVTYGGSPCDESISGESYKYSHAKTESDRERCLNNIRRNGGDRDYYTVSYPPTTSKDDIAYVKTVFQKKQKKYNEYQKHFHCLGLAIVIDFPTFLITGFNWGEWLSQINNSKYTFVAIIYHYGIYIYDFATREYISNKIDTTNINSIQNLARMATERIITDDDPVWQ